MHPVGAEVQLDGRQEAWHLLAQSSAQAAPSVSGAALSLALTAVKRGNGETTDSSGFYTGSRQPGDCQAACLNVQAATQTAYKDLIAKSGTSLTQGLQQLNPVVQQDFTGGYQLTLASDIVKTRLPKVEIGIDVDGVGADTVSDDGVGDGDDNARDVRQVSFDGGQLPLSSCGSWSIIAECESGHHHFAKRLYCGREWCDVCGQDNSAAHKRRMARLLPKLQQVKLLGYFVIEFPDIVRRVGRRGVNPDIDGGELVSGWCYSKADLRDTTNAIIGVMAGKRSAGGRGSKRVKGFFSRGIARWHWFGDKKPGKYNPHLNILVDFDSLSQFAKDELQPDIERYQAQLKLVKQTKAVRHELQGIDMFLRGKSGYLPKPLLDRIQLELRDALNCPELIVHYAYRDTPAKMVHCLRYVTRATFKDYKWSEYMANELYNFRNARWWGSWQGGPVWQLEQAQAEGEDVTGVGAVSSLQVGVCPDCGQPLRVLHRNHLTGQPIQWSQPIDSTYLLIWGAQEIAGTGYYRIPFPVRSGSVFSPGELLRLQQLEQQHKFDAVRRLRPCPDDDELRQKVNALKLDKIKAHNSLSAELWFAWDDDTDDDELGVEAEVEAILRGDMSI